MTECSLDTHNTRPCIELRRDIQLPSINTTPSHSNCFSIECTSSNVYLRLSSTIGRYRSRNSSNCIRDANISGGKPDATPCSFRCSN
eukprot:m.37941 g.37941  ORF g.37941 m.37941 type:complete len:87 (+) comp17792_c0_seq1:1635-1895(+)